ncbi:hypothetical protein HYFRA_00008389 [Hymenoscyphus fraxineus]|uniref:Uncharacterized protein n=1 Tax=Hymenoscyphus fraxineus TaxID=746836 RepID=A0A9N9PP01_9HELO|nr:hypothetical protein HYFRA_00008389 [Hymenoscyphus fraxineus]
MATLKEGLATQILDKHSSDNLHYVQLALSVTALLCLGCLLCVLIAHRRRQRREFEEQKQEIQRTAESLHPPRVLVGFEMEDGETETEAVVSELTPRLHAITRDNWDIE